jgi:peptide/nickel transport system permease protein
MRYLVQRVFVAIPILIAMSIIIFSILVLAPGDPMGEFALDPAITPERREHIRVSLGLDQPLHVRYVKWLFAFVQGDMGYSFTTHSPVSLLLAQRLPATIGIVGTGYLVSILLALPLGILSAMHVNSLFDRIVTVGALLGFSLPVFVTGMVAILIFSIRFDWFPFIYRSTLVVHDWHTLQLQIRQSLMPVMVLAVFQTAGLVRFVRSAMIEQLSQDYVQTARSKGLREMIIVNRHIVRNAFLPIVTLIALGIPNVFTGALVTEQLFRVPGIGSLLVSAMQNSDTPVVMAITFISAILIVLCNLVADILYAVLDPRVRLS